VSNDGDIGSVRRQVDREQATAESDGKDDGSGSDVAQALQLKDVTVEGKRPQDVHIPPNASCSTVGSLAFDHDGM
jgi:hypothetical protein